MLCGMQHNTRVQAIQPESKSLGFRLSGIFESNLRTKYISKSRMALPLVDLSLITVHGSLLGGDNVLESSDLSTLYTISNYDLLGLGEVGPDSLDREGVQWPQHE